MVDSGFRWLTYQNLKPQPIGRGEFVCRVEEWKKKKWKRLEECKSQGVTRKIGEIRNNDDDSNLEKNGLSGRRGEECPRNS